MNNKINALVLIFINLLIPLSAIFSYNLLVSFYLFGFAAALTLWFGKIRRFFKFTAVYLFFGGVYILLVHLLPQWDVMAMSFFIFFQFTPLMMIGCLLFYDYNPSEILSSLQLLPLNRKFIIALTIALRYVPTFQAEFKLMKSSMSMRGIDFTWKHPLRSFSYFITPQLFRSSLLAEELTAAGITKGIEHHVKRTSIYHIHWQTKDSLVLCGFVLGFFAVLMGGGMLI